MSVLITKIIEEVYDLCLLNKKIQLLRVYFFCSIDFAHNTTVWQIKKTISFSKRGEVR